MADIDEIKRLNRLEDFFDGITESGNVPCPFHPDSNPSCSVDLDRQLWYCHVCHIGGSVVDYVLKANPQWLFWDAIKFLAKRVGIDLDNDQKTPQLNTRYISIMTAAATFCHEQLNRPSRIELMHWKGLTEQTINEWQIGYSEGLIDYLLDFATEEELTAVGLLHEGRARFYDRLMIPIKKNGQVVGFAGRADRKPKYINSPNSEIFNKSSLLFGLNPNAIRKAGYAVLVEGYFDVIKLHQNGYRNVVASMGTSFTKAQARILANLASDLRVVYDGDLAGDSAVWGVADSLLQRRLTYRYRNMPLCSSLMNLQVGQCPEGLDPDELSPDEWEQIPFTPFIDRLEQGINRNNVQDYIGLAYGFLPRVEAEQRIAKWSGTIKQDLAVKIETNLGDRVMANYLTNPVRFNQVFAELWDLVGLADNSAFLGIVPDQVWIDLSRYIQGIDTPLVSPSEDFNDLVLKEMFMGVLTRELDLHRGNPDYIRHVLKKMSDLSEW